MSDLLEHEILDRMRTSLREAIQASNDLAVRSRGGEAYDRLRDNLALVEGACRQMAMWRGDSRWLPFGMEMAEAHRRAGGWLRGYTKRVGNTVVFIAWRAGTLNEAFVKLSAQLAMILDILDKMEKAKTGRVGIILPQTAPEERRFGRPTLARPDRYSRKRGLILPPRYRQA